jgi:hypothetical protein
LTDGLDPACSGGGGVDYATEVQPIFSVSCALGNCHGGTKPKRDLDLQPPATVSYDSIVTNGAVVPGDRNASVLYQKVDTGGSMADELTPAEAEIIGTWIDEGAVGP